MTAKKGNKIITATPKKKAKADAGVSDLQILSPDVTRTIGGKTITIREYDFITGLEVRAVGKEFFNSVYEYVTNGTIPSYEQMMQIFVQHRNLLPPMIALAADVDVEWVRSLNDDDGTSLLAAWWIANGPFVYRKVMERLTAEREEKEMKSQIDGQMSSQN